LNFDTLQDKGLKRGSGAKRVLCVFEDLCRGGGAEQLMVNLLPEIRKRGYAVEVAILFDGPNYLIGDLEARGIRTHFLNFQHRWRLVHNTRELREVARSGGFQIFWGHLFFGNLYACLLALTTPSGKSVTTLHSSSHLQPPPRQFKARVYAWLERLVLMGSNAKVAVSEATACEYKAFFNWRNLDVIYNGVTTSANPQPLNVEDRRRIRVSLGVSDEEFLIVVPSRFVAKKGHYVLLDALAWLKSSKDWRPRTIAFGFGPLLEQLRVNAEELGISDWVRLSLPVPQTDLLRIFQAADVVCMPSLHEGLPVAAAEAMSVGAPTVFTKIDGFLELVGDSEASLLVPPNDPVALASALWTLKEDTALRRELGERARRHIFDNFDISVCASNWVSFFDRLRD
jgi:glycosyltransferase involved in cell wall biosynthesis